MSGSIPKSSAAAATEDREIVLTRVFDAPREMVFQTWTDPAHIVSWWGPKGFTTTTQAMDVRVGGEWLFVMHGPDGVDYPNKIKYLQIDRPERLVYDHGDDGGPVHFRVTVTFAAKKEKTELTMRMVFPTAAERDDVVKKYGAIEGANEMMVRLGERLANMGAGEGLVIRRVFDAPRAMVFAAWTEPDRLKRWWGPKGFTNPVCEVDARAGGAIRIHMRAPDGKVYPMAGEFREVTPPERLVFASSALDEQGKALFETLTTVTFAEEGGKTVLTLNARAISQTAAAPQYLAGMQEGWSSSLDKLSEEVRR